jgi:hypothetical protein
VALQGAMALLTFKKWGAFFLNGGWMKSSWEVGLFVIGYFSIVVLSIKSMLLIDKNLRDRKARMKEMKSF